MSAEPLDEADDLELCNHIVLGDGEIHIDHSPEFYEATGSIACMFANGVLYVLKADTLKWVNVEDIKKSLSAKIAAIRGKVNGTD